MFLPDDTKNISGNLIKFHIYLTWQCYGNNKEKTRDSKIQVFFYWHQYFTRYIVQFCWKYFLSFIRVKVLNFKGPPSPKSHCGRLFLFESLYCLYAWSDWLKALNLFALISSSCRALSKQALVSSSLWRIICREIFIIPSLKKGLLRKKKKLTLWPRWDLTYQLHWSYVNFIASCFAMQWILVFNTNAFVYFVL